MRSAAALVSTGLAMALAPDGAASPDSEVASAFDKGDKLDVHVTVHYRFSARRATLKREMAGLPGADPDGPVPLVKDLVVAGARHELVPRLELGVFTDLAITAAIPVVLRQSSRIEFDQGADNCVFPTDPGPATCIDRDNSTTLRDGLLPDEGFDASDPDGGGFPLGDATIFRGVKRSGLDQLHLGLVWAAMNQARDSTKPTWKIGAELRLAVGRTMKLDRANPSKADGASRGVHEVRLYTSMARRISWAEPFFEIYWQGAVATRDNAPLDRPELTFGAEQTGPQQVGGGRFGFEAIPWISRSGDERIGLTLAGHLDAHFEGRGYSDMWEVFAYAGDATQSGPLALDADPTVDGMQAISHPGVSNIENYLTLGAEGGVDAHLGTRVRLDLGFSVDWDQSHLISFADAGSDGGDANDVVDPGSNEVNPLHAPLIDSPGRRYRVDEALDLALTAGMRFLF